MKKNVLVLGGTGFIGRNVIQELLENDYKIVVLVRNIQKSTANFSPSESIIFIEGELRQSQLVESILIEHKIDLVIHLVSNLIPSSPLTDFNVELNEVVFPTFNLLELLSKYFIKIVYFSSGGTIYGKVNDLIDEDKRLNPINYYGYSKLIIENHIRFLNETQNLNYLILRPSNVYGRHQKIEAEQGFIAVALGKFLTNSPIVIWGDGEVIRDFIDVQDISKGLRKLIEANVSNRALNMGSGHGKSLNEVLLLIETFLKTQCNVIYKGKREIDLDKMVLDIARIKGCIDFNPKSLNEGINDFIAILE